MIGRRFLIVGACIAIATSAGIAFALPHAHRTPHARPAPSHTAKPAPTAEPVRTDLPVVAPATGHHARSGPVPVTETHVIHSSGAVGVSSGTIAHGDDVGGAFGTPKP
jgi:hypothetical protein